MEKTETEKPKNEETEKPKMPEWLQKEIEDTNSSVFDSERKPALKLEENKVVNLTIDFSKPFESWKDNVNDTIKKIIPVKVGEVELVWWLNVKNPVYGDILKAGMEGQTEFKVLQTGNNQTTKYTLVKE